MYPLLKCGFHSNQIELTTIVVLVKHLTYIFSQKTYGIVCAYYCDVQTKAFVHDETEIIAALSLLAILWQNVQAFSNRGWARNYVT